LAIAPAGQAPPGVASLPVGVVAGWALGEDRSVMHELFEKQTGY
jgi:hypothetical protein